MDQLVQTSYPETREMMDEIQFRRGEMLFLRKNYIDSEVAYQAVVDHGDESSRFYEQSLYKLGWSQFKLAMARRQPARHSLSCWIARLPKTLILGDGEEQLGVELKRAERELVRGYLPRPQHQLFLHGWCAESIDEFLAQSRWCLPTTT